MKLQTAYSFPEEIINSATHAAGLMMSMAVCTIFLILGTAVHNIIITLSLWLYLFGVISSYAASMAYHSIPSSNVRAKAISRKFDHAAIYWHIAGAYSPLTLIGMRLGGEPTWAWGIFAIVWLSAAIGTGLSFRRLKKQSYLETTCYVLMGLTILIAFKPFHDSCGLTVMLWIIGEGIAYITGAVLYSFKKIPYIHSVFHIFVIIGDICHMIATCRVIRMFIFQ